MILSGAAVTSMTDLATQQKIHSGSDLENEVATPVQVVARNQAK
jgi:hypothetical protein